MERRVGMNKIVLHGRKVSGGSAEGEALVTKSSLGGYGTFDFDTGDVVDINHEWFHYNVKGKVLVFRTAQGSSAWSIAHQALRYAGLSPAAYIVKENNPQTALGSVVGRLPCITELDQDPTEIIDTGDWVQVDAEQGIVEIVKR
jgi:predicted aconitase with swiveling domain